MRREFLLDALGDIDPAYIDEAGAFLYAGAGSGDGRKRPARKVLGALLIAAVIVSLLTVTAFAAGLFGLRSHVSAGGRITFNGYTGSPEARAADEWHDYKSEYYARRFAEGGVIGDEETSWTEESPELAAAEANYGALEREMAEKLVEIAARYDLKLHEWQTSVLTDADFRSAAGLTDGFLTADGLTASSGTIYEDGSFTYSLRTPAAEWEAGRVLLSRCRAGTLMCWTPALHGGSDYAEWTYTNKNGQELCLAISRVEERAEEELMPDDDAYWFGVSYVGGIFYEENGWYVSTVGGLASGDDRAALETLADSVDFSSCCTGGTNVDQYREYKAHELTDSTALSYAEFLAADEVRALREFKQRYSENCGQWSEQVQDWYTPMDIRLAVPGNMDEATAAVRGEICAKYALTAPESVEEYNSSDESTLARIGQEKFTDADLKIDLSYDTGAFTASGRIPAGFELDYITKGSLYINTWSTAFRFLDDASSWMYETANGDEVCIVLGGWGYGCVIYESANAYVLLSASGFVPASITGGDSVPDGMAAYRMERLADSIEFSRLK